MAASYRRFEERIFVTSKPYTLFLQSSSGRMSLGLVQDRKILFDSRTDFDPSPSLSAYEYLTAALFDLKISEKPIEKIYVDIGPGSLGATRSAVAFANAFSFAQGIPVFGINAFQILGFHFEKLFNKPVVCLRNAAKPNYYMGIYEKGTIRHFGYVSEKDALKRLVPRAADHCFCGRYPLITANGASDVGLPETQGNEATIASFLRVSELIAPKEKPSTSVFPLTEKDIIGAKNE